MNYVKNGNEIAKYIKYYREVRDDGVKKFDKQTFYDEFVKIFSEDEKAIFEEELKPIICEDNVVNMSHIIDSDEVIWSEGNKKVTFNDVEKVWIQKYF